MTERRDPIVADALRRLDVPDHDPGFWADLESRLADESDVSGRPTSTTTGDVVGDGDGEDVEIIELRARRNAKADRRHSLPTRQLVAAVLVIVALLAGISLLRPLGDEDSSVGIAGQPDATSTPSTPGTARTPETTPGSVAVEVADAWLSALAEGDVDGAYALLDAGSKERLSRAEFGGLASGLAEGAATFAGVDPNPATFTVNRPGGPQTTVVVYQGDVAREGMIETAAYPVVVIGPATSAPAVAFDLEGPTVEFEPLASPDGTRTSPVSVTVSANEVYVSIDGGAPELRTPDPAGGLEIDVEAVAGAGTHTVTVFSTEGGQYTARSATVVVP